jgi:hypothetical protein
MNVESSNFEATSSWGKQSSNRSFGHVLPSVNDRETTTKLWHDLNTSAIKPHNNQSFAQLPALDTLTL